MIQHIKDAEYSRMVNKNNIHRATGGSDMYLLRYTEGNSLMPLLWLEYDKDATHNRLDSNVSTEKCNILEATLHNYILVHYREIKDIHDTGRYVDPNRIPKVMQEYKQELAQSNIPVLYRIKDNV